MGGREGGREGEGLGEGGGVEGRQIIHDEQIAYQRLGKSLLCPVIVTCCR